MKDFLTFIFAVYVLFLVFMATPFGADWIWTNLDEGKPCYGILIAFAGAIPATIIGMYLGNF